MRAPLGGFYAYMVPLSFPQFNTCSNSDLPEKGSEQIYPFRFDGL